MAEQLETPTVPDALLQDYGAAATPQTPVEPAAPQLTELEQVAVDMGWNPDKETLGEQWVDAKTYIKRTREIQSTQSRTIKEQNRKLDRIVGTVDALKVHYEKVAEAQQREFDSKNTALKAERRVAIAENDPDKVENIDSQIDGLRDAKAKAGTVPTPATQPGDAVLEDWVADHSSWYNVDKDLTAYAHKRARLYRVSEIGDDALYRETLDEIAREVKKEFPEKFGKRASTPKVTPPADGVEGVRPGPIGGRTDTKTFTRASLNEDQRRIYDSFVNDLGLDGKKIIEDWVAMGELK
jgi:hypothetical protein